MRSRLTLVDLLSENVYACEGEEFRKDSQKGRDACRLQGGASQQRQTGCFPLHGVFQADTDIESSSSG